MKVDVILGLQWGDEGKGKIVDVLASNYDIIARFQGGPNAGHTLEFDGRKFVLHTIPSGIFHENKINVIGNGVVFDPVVFADELSLVENINPQARKNLMISKRAHLILPTHRLIDTAYENAKGDARIGSTLKGIAPAYTDKFSRIGVRIGDILDRQFDFKLSELKRQHLRILDMLGCNPDNMSIDKMPFHEFSDKWTKSIELIRNLNLVDSEIYLNDCLKSNKSILAEGAQGALLDIDFGSYPFVTSSNTTSGGVCTGLGIAPRYIANVFGVFKAYCTRVGNGPFPTEQDNSVGNLLRNKGAEFGATTGRPRRCGWLDLPALRYAITINGVNQLIMTKADVLGIFDIINVCTHYRIDKKNYTLPPFEICREDISPVYKEIEGWRCQLADIIHHKDMPEKLKRYIETIQTDVDVNINMVSVGADRKQIISLE